MIITIDGPSGSGKSTIAKELAKALGYTYFDTGAMYRAITYAIFKESINPEEHEELANFLKSFKYHVKLIDHQKHHFVGDENVTEKIRSPEVTEKVSSISAIPLLRRHLVNIQRDFAKEEPNAVYEGRDIGTVVFPNADIKFFITASPEVRAQRRYQELIKKDPTITLEKVLTNINRRDRHDSTRKNSPLKQAADAKCVDTSNLTIQEVVKTLLKLCG